MKSTVGSYVKQELHVPEQAKAVPDVSHKLFGATVIDHVLDLNAIQSKRLVRWLETPKQMQPESGRAPHS
jgi:hypothetical protein